MGVGRTQRGLPGWLRDALDLIHRRCRGPYCDRKTTWSDADHTTRWEHLGETSLDNSVPLCRGAERSHHQMVTTGGWNYAVDHDTGIATWTAPNGTTIRAHPPPRRTGPAP